MIFVIDFSKIFLIFVIFSKVFVIFQDFFTTCNNKNQQLTPQICIKLDSVTTSNYMREVLTSREVYNPGIINFVSSYRHGISVYNRRQFITDGYLLYITAS